MSHASKAKAFLADKERSVWQDQAIWFIRQKRDNASAMIPEWEALRQQASDIKAHTISRLEYYLEEFEQNARANGIHVHWAIDDEEHNQIVHSILKKHDVKRIVKSKSMLTEECHLNPYLEKHGMVVTDTDLGEWIIQLNDEPPSHIVIPAIHKKREDVAEIFHKHIGTDKDETDPTALTEAARQYLRQEFLKADAGITGVNFAIAETGGIVVCTNEGNADLGVARPPLHIACMGMEKLIPKLEDLAVFTRLLARSATGQPITTYTSHFHGPGKDSEMHIIIVDNGRSRLLAREEFKRSLSCIRCGACMNTCPVYRRSGGHSYGVTVPGPIGSALAPNADLKEHASLPFASTLCGSCTDVCPVKIDLHTQLLAWRKHIYKAGHISKEKIKLVQRMSSLLNSPFKYKMASKLARWVPKSMIKKQAGGWVNGRSLPEIPKQSFRELYKRRKGGSK